MKTLPAGVTEAQTLTGDLEVGCDVCVIGSGPGGAVAASVLAAAGKSVVVVEEGGYFTSARFRQREDDAYPYLYQDGAQRTTKDLAITIMQGKAVGGGSVVNWTTCFRTPNDVVERWRTRHGVGDIDSAALAPHFAWAEQRLGVNKVPLELVNKNNRTVWDGCQALRHDVDTVQRNVVGCAQTGNCGHGCPIDAKQSMLVTCIPDAIKAGAAVLSRCRVERIVYEGSRAVAVVGKALDAFGLGEVGATITVKPRAVIVAAGAINGPALLLRSGTPDPHGRLGLRTFLHPVVASIALFPEPIEGWKGAPQSVASHHYAHRGDEVGWFLEAGPVHPMLASTAMPSFGTAHREGMKRLKFAAAHLAITIDGHHDDVVGGVVSLDGDGRPVLEYPIVERQWRAFRDAQKTMAHVAFAAGAREVWTGHDPSLHLQRLDDVPRIDDLPWGPCQVGVFSAHQMGGCGMSDDPRHGVARSRDGRHHHVENLYVMDGSLFPTSVGVNPQMSIYGLVHLLATRVATTIA
jgi:choline dehydrogenase-like flavoprotein